MSDYRFRTDEADPVFRFDRTAVKGEAKKTDNGFLFSDSVLTRAGIFEYLLSNGTVQRELRPAEEVFSVDSLESLKMVPLTNGHPDTGKVDAENAKVLQVGHVGENIRKDSDDVMGNLLVTDKNTITLIENGNKDVSCGYSCDLVSKSGVYKGKRFDAIQTNIRYNHVAVAIHRGRAGNAKINLDSAIAEEITTIPVEGKNMPELKKIVLDGVEYEAEAPVIAEVTKQKATIDALKDSATTKGKEHTDAVATLEGERDTLKEEVKTLKADTGDTEKFDAAVKARIELIGSASEVLKGDALKGIADKTEIEIKKAVILAKSPDAKLDDKEDVYITARYDAVLDSVTTEDGGIDFSKLKGPATKTDEQKKEDEDKGDSDSARLRMINNLETAHNPKEDK